ncbi:MAG: PIN domain-containing protein [Candidatus Cloacimonetes bacterium]|nr:PIN domain-containing protein [Candidatus Cloacimonadota bacterium]
MKKIRLYLDTSVISHLESPETPDKMQETLTLWEDIKAGKYEIVLSYVVFDELDKCFQPKRRNLYNLLNEIKYSSIENTDDIDKIADQIIQMDILKQKSIDDATHIACAIVNDCDFIVSWNFKHMVNPKTISGVRSISNIYRYRNIEIVSPQMLINQED